MFSFFRFNSKWNIWFIIIHKLSYLLTALCHCSVWMYISTSTCWWGTLGQKFCHSVIVSESLPFCHILNSMVTSFKNWKLQYKTKLASNLTKLNVYFISPTYVYLMKWCITDSFRKSYISYVHFCSWWLNTIFCLCNVY